MKNKTTKKVDADLTETKTIEDPPRKLGTDKTNQKKARIEPRKQELQAIAHSSDVSSVSLRLNGLPEVYS